MSNLLNIDFWTNLRQTWNNFYPRIYFRGISFQSMILHYAQSVLIPPALVKIASLDPNPSSKPFLSGGFTIILLKASAVQRTVSALESDYVEDGIPDIALDAFNRGDCYINLFLFRRDLMFVLYWLWPVKYSLTSDSGFLYAFTSAHRRCISLCTLPNGMKMSALIGLTLLIFVAVEWLIEFCGGFSCIKGMSNMHFIFFLSSNWILTQIGLREQWLP